ncbi:guanine deaminase-like isoform X2 [Halichondria panicea]|uniref:guanine deaminase-like isoform X2 n=1 Tax=Halichondria panicea TaxID=6063 RepID=UPI00312B2D42
MHALCMMVVVYRGTLVHCVQSERIEVLRDHLIGFNEQQNGEIVFVEPACKADELAQEHGFSSDSVTVLTESQFLLPGLVDSHTHPDHYLIAGTGYDKQLLEWVNDYIVPLEAKFKDVQLAKDVYRKAVRRSLLHGTTTASYFATIHLESTKELCRIVDCFGQRALIGKINIDVLSPDYTEEIQASIDDTRKFIKFVQEMQNPLIQAVLLPAALFACSPKLLKMLSQIAKEHSLHIHSHICEQKASIQQSLELHPEYNACSTAFNSYGLLTAKTYMAHCVYLEESDMQLFKQKGVGVVHCPNSNLCLRSGLLDARKMLDMGLKIGLGTDVSGGYSLSVLDALRKSIDVSKALSFSKQDDYRPITHHEALYMATLGGAKATADDVFN